MPRDDPVRGPQSEQSEPNVHKWYSEPKPPSSQSLRREGWGVNEELCRIASHCAHQSLRWAQKLVHMYCSVGSASVTASVGEISCSATPRAMTVKKALIIVGEVEGESREIARRVFQRSSHEMAAVFHVTLGAQRRL